MNKWVEHVKAFSKKHHIAYGCAISNDDCKREYRESKSKSVKEEKPQPTTSGIVKKKPFIIEEETKIEPVKEEKKFNQTAINKVMQDKFLPLEIKKFLPDYESNFKYVKLKLSRMLFYYALMERVKRLTTDKSSPPKFKPYKNLIIEKSKEVEDLYKILINAILKQVKVYFDSKSKYDKLKYDNRDVDDFTENMYKDAGLDTRKNTFDDDQFDTFSIDCNNFLINSYFESMLEMGLERKQAKKIFFEAKREQELNTTST